MFIEHCHRGSVGQQWVATQGNVNWLQHMLVLDELVGRVVEEETN